jgi:hypothetical protein
MPPCLCVLGGGGRAVPQAMMQHKNMQSINTATALVRQHMCGSICSLMLCGVSPMQA